MSEETHILSIRSLSDGNTIAFKPENHGTNRVVRVTLRGLSINPDASVLIEADSILLAATSLHALVNDIAP